MRIRVEWSFFRGVIDVQQRLPKFVGIVSSQLSTSAQEMLKAENHGAIAFLDIPPGSRRIRARHQLNQVVPVIDSPVLCLPAPGNESPVFQACRNREIQAGSIGAALATRYNFSKHFEHLVASQFRFWGLPVNPSVRESFRIREAR